MKSKCNWTVGTHISTWEQVSCWLLVFIIIFISSWHTEHVVHTWGCCALSLQFISVVVFVEALSHSDKLWFGFTLSPEQSTPEDYQQTALICLFKYFLQFIVLFIFLYIYLLHLFCDCLLTRWNSCCVSIKARQSHSSI